MTLPTDRGSTGCGPRTTLRLRLEPKVSATGYEVRLGGYNRQPIDTIEVIGLNRGTIHLLVVPDRIDSELARVIMMSAEAEDDTFTVAALLRDNGFDGGAP